MIAYDAGDTGLQTTGGASEDNKTVWTSVTAERHVHIESELHTSEGKRVVSFSQSLSYSNEAAYADQGWVQVCPQCGTPRIIPVTYRQVGQSDDQGNHFI